MIYGTVCSGIEAPSVAWETLGWTPRFFSEIEAFPRAVLAHRYPDVPCHGDFTTIQEGDYGSVDLVCAGTPCQDFSVAGLRKGLDGERGDLTIQFVSLLVRLRPRWVVWENVPGILSIDRGWAFASFLDLLGKCGYGFAYRVLDAQHFGVPQRRRRVFVVGYLGDWRPAAAVLFEPESLRGDSAPRRETGQGVAAEPEDGVIGCLAANMGHGNQFAQSGQFVAKSIPARSQLAQNSRNELREMPYSGALSAEPGMKQTAYVREAMSVRRFTPRECERLQGFDDDWTLVPYRGKPAADGPRYRAIGNSMAVPVVRWIGERIQMVTGIIKNPRP